MNIKVFKLANGDDLISEVVETAADKIELKNPAQIVLQQTQQGVGVGLAPYMPFIEGNLMLSKSALVAEGEPKKEMSSEYNRIFGSGIVVAPASTLSALATAT